MATEVWLLQYDCGDYYCDGDHVLGVFTTRQKAMDGETDHREKTTRSDKHLFEYRISEWQPDELALTTR